MKKIIESDLIAIAHRILKLRGKSEIEDLFTETQKLYEKLTVLKFYENNMDRLEQATSTELMEELLLEEKADSTPKHVTNPMMSNEIVHELLDEAQPTADKFSAEKSVAENMDNTSPTKEIASFEVDNIFNVPFEKVEFEAVSEEKTQQSKKVGSPTLNDAFTKTITLTLNDRIAFEKNLFNNNSEDLNRVISQLNTMSDWDEAENFINQIVKPDFNHWKGKEEYENRFIYFIQKRFL